MDEGDRAVGRRRRRRRADPPREGLDFVFAVAADEHDAVGRRGREHRRRRLIARERHHFDVRQRVEEAGQVAGPEQGLGGDDGQRLQPGDARQQIVVGRPQTVAGRGEVGHRDDDARQRRGAGLEREQARPQAVLVDQAGGGERDVVGAEGGGEEARLLEQAGRAAIERRPALERGADQALEVVDGAAVAVQRVVELEHRGDERRAQRERRRRSNRGHLARHCPGQHFARDRIDARQRAERIAEQAIQPGAGDDVRQRDGERRRVAGTHRPVVRAERGAVRVGRDPARHQAEVLEGVTQDVGRARARHDHGGAAGLERRRADRRERDRLLQPGEVGHPHQAGAARRDRRRREIDAAHGATGGRSSAARSRVGALGHLDGAGGGGRRFPGDREVLRLDGAGAAAAGALGEADGAEHRGVRAAGVGRDGDGLEQRRQPGQRQVEGGEAVDRRPRQGTNLVERGAMRGEKVEPRRDVAPVAAQGRRPAGPLIAGELETPRGIETRVDQRQQALHRLGPGAAERGVAFDDPGADAQETADVLGAAGSIERPDRRLRQGGVADVDAPLAVEDPLGRGRAPPTAHGAAGAAARAARASSASAVRSAPGAASSDSRSACSMASCSVGGGSTGSGGGGSTLATKATSKAVWPAAARRPAITSSRSASVCRTSSAR